MNALQKDRRMIAQLSQTLDRLVREQQLWTVPATYNRADKLPLTEPGRDIVTNLVRFLLEHDAGPLSVMKDASNTTVDVQVLTISPFELNDLFMAVRKWKEKHHNRKQRIVSLRFRLSVSGNEDPSSVSRLRSL